MPAPHGPASHSYGPRADIGSSALRRTDLAMLDAIFLASGIVFFLVTAAYGDGCDRL